MGRLTQTLLATTALGFALAAAPLALDFDQGISVAAFAKDKGGDGGKGGKGGKSGGGGESGGASHGSAGKSDGADTGKDKDKEAKDKGADVAAADADATDEHDGMDEGGEHADGEAGEYGDGEQDHGEYGDGDYGDGEHDGEFGDGEFGEHDDDDDDANEHGFGHKPTPAELGRLNGFLHASDQGRAHAAPGSAVGAISHDYADAIGDYLDARERIGEDPDAKEEAAEALERAADILGAAANKPVSPQIVAQINSELFDEHFSRRELRKIAEEANEE